jgi:hypothetical protein
MLSGIDEREGRMFFGDPSAGILSKLRHVNVSDLE